MSVVTSSCRVHLSTARVSGALAVVTLVGDVESILSPLTAIDAWPVGRVRHIDLEDLDDLLVMRPAEETALLTPHGGPRIVERLVERLVAFGARVVDEPWRTSAPDELRRLYPEASDIYEARMLAMLARAASPLAIPILLKQPARWRALDAAAKGTANRSAELATRSAEDDARLERLLVPPRVAIVGPPNAGKSTLLNRLVGRTVAIASEQPGTTRDHVVARVDMMGLVVDLLDTPGLRTSDDDIERDALRIASRALAEADLIIALAAPEQSWPVLPRRDDHELLRVGGHADRGERKDASLSISGLTGAGIDALRRAVRTRLIGELDDSIIDHERDASR